MSLTMKNRTLILLTTAMLLLAPIAQAKEAAKPKKPLSMKKVRVLSLLPINTPTYFYLKKPIAGTLLTLTQASGLALAIRSTISFANLKDTDCGSNSFKSQVCNALAPGFTAIGKATSIGGMIVGYSMWLGTYIPTAILAPKYARKYNESIMPIVSVTNRAAQFGIAGRF